MSMCFHPEKWKDSAECDLCRYRTALEKIVSMSIRGDINPRTKGGREFFQAVEIASIALFHAKPSEGQMLK